MFQRLFKPRLFHILALGCFLRIAFIFVGNHIYYPDELYQTLEPAHRLVYGYGIIPWEYQYGLRSYLAPVLVSIPLYFSRFMSVSDPAVYHFIVRIFLVLMSLSVIPAVYYLVRSLTKNNYASLASSFIAAVWYELIYFSARPLSEVISTYLFSFGIIFWLIRQKKLILSAVLFQLGALLRPQYFPVFLIIGYMFTKQGKGSQFFKGSLISLIFYGLLDAFFLKGFFSSLSTYFNLSGMSGISSLFGISPWWLYLEYMLIGSSFLGFLSLISYKNRQSIPVLISFAAVLLVHSVIPHKEYRFIFILIPIWISLLGMVIGKWSRRSVSYLLALACFISFLGYAGKLPDQDKIYPYKLNFTDPLIGIYQNLASLPDTCGIYDTTSIWQLSPGYYFTHQNIPLYTRESPPQKPEYISHYLTSDQGLTVHKRSGNCIADPAYSYNRNIPEVDQILNRIGAKPLK